MVLEVLKCKKKYYNEEKEKIIMSGKPIPVGSSLDEEVHRLIAVPSVAGHPTGGAVDVVIVDKNSNTPIDFGSKIYDFKTKDCYTFSPYISEEAKKNRMLLRNAMMSQGFAPFDGEWWHFSYGDKEWAFYYKKDGAIYTQKQLSEVKVVEKQDIGKYLFEKFGVRDLTEIKGGHKGSYLLRGVSDKGEQLCFKMGINDKSRKEVEDNLYGYNQLRILGAESLLPDPIVEISESNFNGLKMSFLGKPIVDSLRQGSASDWMENINWWRRIFSEAKIFNSADSWVLIRDSIGGVVEKIKSYGQILADCGLLHKKDINYLDGLDIEMIAKGQLAALQLLDFTPDNVFLFQDKIKFIDPWRQKSYLGSPIPGLNQFLTLSRDVHSFPLSEQDWKAGENIIDQIGESLGLKPQQVEFQKRLGAALQYSLSAYVRRNSEKERAHLIAKKCVSEIIQLPNKNV